MHGGTNKGAAKGNSHAWRHGNRSAEAEEQIKTLSQSNRDIRMVQKLSEGRQLTSRQYDRLMALYIERAAQP